MGIFPSQENGPQGLALLEQAPDQRDRIRIAFAVALVLGILFIRLDILRPRRAVI